MPSTRVGLSIFYNRCSFGTLIQECLGQFLQNNEKCELIQAYYLFVNSNRGDNIRLVLDCADQNITALLSAVENNIRDYISKNPSSGSVSEDNPINLFSDYPNNSIQYNHFALPKVGSALMDNLRDEFSHLVSKLIAELNYREYAVVDQLFREVARLLYFEIARLFYDGVDVRRFFEWILLNGTISNGSRDVRFPLNSSQNLANQEKQLPDGRDVIKIADRALIERRLATFINSCYPTVEKDRSGVLNHWKVGRMFIECINVHLGIRNPAPLYCEFACSH